MGHAVSTWSAVCSEVPHSQFGEGARPHLCMDEWNRPTPVRRRLSLTFNLSLGQKVVSTFNGKNSKTLSYTLKVPQLVPGAILTH